MVLRPMAARCQLRVRGLCLLISGILLAACVSPPVDQIELMPAPDVYGEDLLNPLPEEYPFDRIPYDGILFATDRSPAGESDQQKYYLNNRGQVVRLGYAEVEFGEKDLSWELARHISMLKTRSTSYPVKISAVEEWGIMSSTVPHWIDLELDDDQHKLVDAEQRFAAAINAQLAVSRSKEVYIYVHGYKVPFENPVLVSAELWHFLGYDGAFIAYAWPSTPSRWAYIRDSDTAAGYARNLRLMLDFLRDQTDAEEIHIIGYSNGTRLVVRALDQLALIHQAEDEREIYRDLRLGNVFLLGSDLDRDAFGSYVSDGLLNVSKHVYVYVSRHDRALGVAQFLTRQQRLGQLWGGAGGELHPQARQAIETFADRVSYINVSDAEGSDSANGHGYFRASPWASSDILMALFYGLGPSERGLVRQDDLPVYTFPPDYIWRLWDAIEKVDPKFAEDYRQFKLTGELPAPTP